MKLHRDLKVTQKTAWFMLRRIREAWSAESESLFSGPVEADETYMGGRRANMSKAKRKTLSGRGAVGKEAVIGKRLCYADLIADNGLSSGARSG